MSHHCSEKPATVGELIEELQSLDPSLEVYETWDEVPGWFEVGTIGIDGGHREEVLWLGVRKCGVGSDTGQCRNR